jgi:hypothetical protein
LAVVPTRALQEAARARGVELAVRLVERPERIVPEIEEARRAGAEAPTCWPPPSSTRGASTSSSVRLRCACQPSTTPEFAEEGGLIGYGPRITQMFRQLARQLAKVFSGEKLGDVPVEQPTTFGLAINLQAREGNRLWVNVRLSEQQSACTRSILRMDMLLMSVSGRIVSSDARPENFADGDDDVSCGAAVSHAGRALRLT